MKTGNKKRLIYHLKLAAVFAAAAAMLAVGSEIIHVNCYNAMNSDSISLFSE